MVHTRRQAVLQAESLFWEARAQQCPELTTQRRTQAVRAEDLHLQQEPAVRQQTDQVRLAALAERLR